MKNYQKYSRNYHLPPVMEYKWVKQDAITAPPIWCSVDLRDGNQALIVPMSLEEKVEFFLFLVKLGFKEIEVGFPAASDTEYAFLRKLIEEDLIPQDVTVQVLTQSREHIIRKTFQALRGIRRAVVHLYNSTSVAQREQVFHKSREEIVDIAVSGAQLILDYAQKAEGEYCFEYSPESFTGTEMDFALEICNRVLDVWQPTPQKKVIINLPATVSFSMPHVYASQIEFMGDHLHHRESVILSIHPHNDRGCAVADSEMGLLAGAERIEGTIFGNGERTGNVDLVTLALNMYSQGVDPGLDFSDMPHVCAVYERLMGMPVGARQPYAGQLVFAAFSGSHQDAIAKGMRYRQETSCAYWNVPYLPIDPKDVGREYDGDVIRINSQSGKGGIGYLMEQKFGYNLPARMREDFGYTVKGISDREHRELLPQDVAAIFEDQYVNVSSPICLVESHFIQQESIRVCLILEVNGQRQEWLGTGNGRLDAVSNTLKEHLGLQYTIETYEEHALEKGSRSRACAYVGICDASGVMAWGAGIHEDIMSASIHALVSAINRKQGGNP